MALLLDDPDRATILRTIDQHRARVDRLSARILQDPLSGLRQQWFNSIAKLTHQVACFEYAVGAPISVVRDQLAVATDAFVELFRLRGTYKSIVTTVVSRGVNSSGGRPEQINEVVDLTMTNSRKAHIAMCDALLAGQTESAMVVSDSEWDAPDAEYEPAQGFCSQDDVVLAAAFRDLFLNKLDDARTTLESAVVRGEWAKSYRVVLGAMIDSNPKMLRLAIESHLTRFGVVNHPRSATSDPDEFLCVRVLGACRIALNRETLSPGDLAFTVSQIPLELALA